jgi:DNA-binding NarL/FixJ family response regulator
MSQWGVQLVIGRLLTDDEFRRRFEQQGCECLALLRERGIDLTDSEIAAFVDVDRRVWSAMAPRIDSRLRPGVANDPPRDARRRPLTIREQHVLRGVFEGLTNKQIAVALNTSEAAVKATMQHLFRKSHVRTRTQLVRAVIEGSLGAPQRGR